MNQERRLEIIKEFGKNENDTGSAAVQIALLTAEINHLNDHLAIHKKDNHSRRGLLIKVGKRRNKQKLLMKHIASYDEVLAEIWNVQSYRYTQHTVTAAAVEKEQEKNSKS